MPPTTELVRRLLQGSGRTEFARGLMMSKCHALVSVRARTAFDAERRGLEVLDRALAWLVTRSRDARGVVDGRLVPFERSLSLTYPRRRDLVAVRGVISGRAWLRSPGGSARESVLSLEPKSALLEPPLPTDLAPTDARALGAMRRAHFSVDPINAILALWEAIDLYVGNTGPEHMFSDRQRDEVLKAVAEHGPRLTDQQTQRVNEIIHGLNAAPLRVRLRTALARDGVPYTEGEFSTLWRTRTIRNDVVHGRIPPEPDIDDLRHCLSFVSRMLVQRMVKSG